MNRRIAFYYTFLLIIATMFTALGNYQNIYATSTFSGLSNGTLNNNWNGTLNNNWNGTLNILTPFNDEVDNPESNNLKDCANCIGNDDINPGTPAPLISNDNPDENDIDSRDGNNDDGDGNNDNGDLGIGDGDGDGNGNNDDGDGNNDNGDLGIGDGDGNSDIGDGDGNSDIGDGDGNGNNDDGDGNNDNGDIGDGNGDNPNENDVSWDSPFSLPFNSQFADPSDDGEGDTGDKIPFP